MRARRHSQPRVLPGAGFEPMRCSGGVGSLANIMAVDHDAIGRAPQTRGRGESPQPSVSVGTCGAARVVYARVRRLTATPMSARVGRRGDRSSGARTPLRRRMQLGAEAAVWRRSPGAPTAAAPRAVASAPGSSIRPAGKAGACGRRGALSSCRAAGASRPIALAPESAMGEFVGARALKEAPACFLHPFNAPLCVPVRMSVRVVGRKR